MGGSDKRLKMGIDVLTEAFLRANALIRSRSIGKKRMHYPVSCVQAWP